MKEKCGECRFFERVDRKKYELPFDGLCMRFPPTLVVGQDEPNWSAYPPTDAENWCGEFKERTS